MMIFDKFFHTMTKPWFIVIYLSCLILSYHYLDIPVAEWMRHHLILSLSYKKTLLPLLHGITHLAIGNVYMVGFFLLAIFFRYIYKKPTAEARCWFLWLSVLFCSSICLLLKVSLGRARPDLWFGWKIYGFHGFQTDSMYWSFPSGHTTTIMSICFGLAILFPRFGLGAILLGFLVAISRVFLIQHYISDVAAAFLLTFFEMALLRAYLPRRLLLINRSDTTN